MSGQRLVALYSAEFSAIHRNEDSLAWQSLVSTHENNFHSGSAGFSMFQLCASRADSPAWQYGASLQESIAHKSLIWLTF